MHAAAAALHAEARATHARDGDRRADFETTHALALRGHRGLHAAALHAHHRVGQAGAFELPHAREFHRAVRGQRELGAVGQFQRHEAIGRGDDGAAFGQAGARRKRLAGGGGLAADVHDARFCRPDRNHGQRDVQFQADRQLFGRDDLVQRLQRIPVGGIARVRVGDVDQRIAGAHAVDEVLAQRTRGLAMRDGTQQQAGKQDKRSKGAVAAHGGRFSGCGMGWGVHGAGWPSSWALVSSRR